ncbi:MAG: IS3 family transposase [Oscillospiraceae bacterium]
MSINTNPRLNSRQNPLSSSNTLNSIITQIGYSFTQSFNNKRIKLKLDGLSPVEYRCKVA